MKNQLCFATLTLAVAACQVLAAQTAAPATAPATRPANATGICKDGSFSTSASKSGACRGHKGIQDWYTVAAAAPAKPSAMNPHAAAAPTAAAPSPSTQARTQNQAAAQSAAQSTTPPATTSIMPPAAQAAPSSKGAKNGGPKANLASMPEAPGGGPNLVWVNTPSNVYHCPGTDFYGKTKVGAYMSESDAKAKGAHGVRGKTCSK